MTEFITENYDAIIDIVTKIIAACAAIAAVTPSKFDNDLLSKVSGFINLLGLNVGRARNADDA